MGVKFIAINEITPSVFIIIIGGKVWTPKVCTIQSINKCAQSYQAKWTSIIYTPISPPLLRHNTFYVSYFK